MYMCFLLYFRSSHNGHPAHMMCPELIEVDGKMMEKAKAVPRQHYCNSSSSAGEQGAWAPAHLRYSF